MPFSWVGLVLLGFFTHEKQEFAFFSLVFSSQGIVSTSFEKVNNTNSSELNLLIGKNPRDKIKIKVVNVFPNCFGVNCLNLREN